MADTTAQAQIEALHDWDLIDEKIYGGYDAYQEILSSGDPAAPSPTFDLARAYEEHYADNPPDPALMPFDDSLEAPLEAPLEDDDTTYPIGYGGAPTFVRDEVKVGRNDPCPCGSGKKYKKCCGKS